MIMIHVRCVLEKLRLKIEEIKNNIELNEAIRNNELDSLRQERIENYRAIRELYYIIYKI